MIYLDNAATTFPKPECVYSAVDNFNRNIGANPGRSGYSLAREASKIVNETRCLLAKLFNINNPNQIIFTTNATEAINLGLKGLLQVGDHVVTTVAEHNSVLRPLRSLEDNKGVKVTRVRCDKNGYVDPEDIRVTLQPNTKLVCISHASNVTGAIQDIRAISKIVHENDTLLMIDSAQTAGNVVINVQEIDIDMLAFTGHKGLYGPQGTGGLYIKQGLNIKPLLEGGTGSESSSDRQPRNMPDYYEGGTHNTPGIAGLGAGVRFILDIGVDIINQHEKELTEILISKLLSIRDLKLIGPPTIENRVAVVSFNISDWPPLNLTHILANGFDIATRSGVHCSPLIHDFIDTAGFGTVRVSIGYFNLKNDIDNICYALEQLTNQS
jgi:cysteine desulfurase / selenocysteine lyase